MSLPRRIAEVFGIESDLGPGGEKPLPAPQAPANPVGIVCRGCGCRHFHLVEIRPALAGRIMKRRECRHCGRRLTTYETPNPEEAHLPWWRRRTKLP